MTAVTLCPAGTYSRRATHAIADEIEFRAPVTQIDEAVATGSHDRGVIPAVNGEDVAPCTAEHKLQRSAHTGNIDVSATWAPAIAESVRLSHTSTIPAGTVIR